MVVVEIALNQPTFYFESEDCSKTPYVKCFDIIFSGNYYSERHYVCTIPARIKQIKSCNNWPEKPEDCLYEGNQPEPKYKIDEAVEVENIPFNLPLALILRNKWHPINKTL